MRRYQTRRAQRRQNRENCCPFKPLLTYDDREHRRTDPRGGDPLEFEERGMDNMERNPGFERYIGIDYSGAQTPDSSLKGLRVFMADAVAHPLEVPPPPKPAQVLDTTRHCGVALGQVERTSTDAGRNRPWILVSTALLQPAPVAARLDDLLGRLPRALADR